jgi:large subunit ribosomal protein L31
MKEKIHPVLNEVLVHCTCGNEFKTRSTKKEMRVEICAACHPFFTGKQKLLDSEGRVEKFNRKWAKKPAVPVAAAPEAAEAAPAAPAAAPATDAQ